MTICRTGTWVIDKAYHVTEECQTLSTSLSFRCCRYIYIYIYNTVSCTYNAIIFWNWYVCFHYYSHRTLLSLLSPNLVNHLLVNSKEMPKFQYIAQFLVGQLYNWIVAALIFLYFPLLNWEKKLTSWIKECKTMPCVSSSRKYVYFWRQKL